MRNLKKILALVLALVMSLSLMATASAASFPDVDDDNPYATAIEVLDELKVFQGYKEDNTFRPTEDLNRAQAAVLVYRIATGDAEDKQVANYTEMANSKFVDLDGYNWAKGYINYCQNAGIVIGTDATHFAPGAKVTGYQLLVMLLRTLGYGQAGEFSNGRTWELQTAKIAEREGILKNISTGDLGAPAKRQMVAEILFQGLLTETVQYSITIPDGYTKNKTLGMREFGLEEIEGVVVANEFADLYSSQVLPEGKTDVQVEGEDNVRTLNYGTKITDIGESRLIYTQNKSKVLSIADSGNNTTKEYGEDVDISTAAKFRTVAEMPAATDIEYYKNFDINGYYTSDYRLEYEFQFDDTYFNTKANRDSYNNGLGDWTYVSGNVWTYNRVIPAQNRITDIDDYNMWYIFTYSNGKTPAQDNTTSTRYNGKVFVGTQTKDDVSDEISYNRFTELYYNNWIEENWTVSGNGWWVKFIDNDGDGECDYAFRTYYYLDEAISSYKNKAGDTVMQYNVFNDDDHTDMDDDYTVRYMEDDEAVECNIAVGDIVLAARIDNQILVSKAESVTTSATSYNYKDDEIKAADGETYGQSEIGQRTDMQSYIANMAPNTEYEMFLDKFGFVRAYRQPGGTKYALVTELYYTNGQYGNLQQNWPMTAELTMPDADGNPVTKEYSVASASQLTAKQAWTLVNSRASTGSYYNWLQPAIAHLGVTRTGYAPTTGTPVFANDDPLPVYSTYWSNDLQLIKNIKTWGAALQEFDYGTQTYKSVQAGGANVAQTDSSSFTNIAIVNGDDTVTLTGAAKLNLLPGGGVDGNHPYAVDYIQLSKARPVKAAASYAIDDNKASSTYEENNNWYVNADKNTEFYIVYDKGVKYFTDYANMPALTEKLVGNIHAAYAVARNTNTGVDAKNYWMADVIVYEVEKWDDATQTSISLAYYTASQQLQTASSVTVNTLNSKATPAKIDLTPSGLAWGTSNNWWDNWGSSWKGYGFYQLYDEKLPAEGETVMTAKKIEAISEKFAAKGIYAGTVTQEVETAIKGGYIPVNIDRNNTVTVNGTAGVLATEIRLSISDSKVYSVTDKSRTNWTDYNYYTEADNLQYNNVRWSEVKAGDRIIWVGEAKENLAVSGSNFIVDLGNPDNTISNPLLNNYDLWLATPQWLGGGSAKSNGTPTVVNGSLWSAIMYEQENPVTPAKEFKVTVNCVDATDNTKILKTLTYEVDKNGSVFIPTSEITLPGCTAASTLTNVTTGETIIESEGVVNGAAVDGYWITGITKNMTVTAAQTKDTLTLALTSGGTIALKVNDTTVTPAPTTGVTTNVVVGDKYEYTVTGLNNVTKYYELTDGTGKNLDDLVSWNDAGTTATIKGTMGGTNLALTLTDKGNRDTAKVSLGTTTGATVTGTSKNNTDTAIGTSWPANVLLEKDVTFTVTLTTPATTKLGKVTYTVEGKDPVTIPAKEGVYTIPGDVVTGLDITIDVEVLTTADIDVTFAGDADAITATKMSTDGATWKPAANVAVTPVDGSATLWLTVGAIVKDIQASDGAVVTADPAGQSTTYKVTNITAATTITLSKTNVEEIVQPGAVQEGNPVVPAGGMAYSSAYSNVGVKAIQYTDKGATIPVDAAKFSEVIADSTNHTEALTTMRPHAAGAVNANAKVLAVGVAFETPIAENETGSVKVYKSSTPLDETQIAAINWGEGYTSTKATTDNGQDFRPNGVLNIWTKIATGEHDASAGNGCLLKDITPVAAAGGSVTTYVYMQFCDSTGANIGPVICREITVAFE